jgi:hypothetical protein
MRSFLPLILALAMCATAWSQTTQPTTTPDQVLTKLLKSPTSSGKALQPVTQGAVDKTSGSGSVAAAPTLNVIREGSTISERIGRLTKSPDGQQMEFAFESDGSALRDPPVILLPNLKLMLMENEVSSLNHDLRFRITGTVTEYKGRNYVLVEKVVVVQEATDPLK